MSKRAIVVHGTFLARDGGLGMNKLILDAVVAAWGSGRYSYIVLPHGASEDSGEGKPFVAALFREYLLEQSIPEDKILFSPDAAFGIASDTSGEAKIAAWMLVAVGVTTGFSMFLVDTFAFFPHSLKVRRVWNAVLHQDKILSVRFSKVHHIIQVLPSWFDTGKCWAAGFVTAFVGMYDPLGRHWPATIVKKRRRDLYTPAHLRDRVIF